MKFFNSKSNYLKWIWNISYSVIGLLILLPNTSFAQTTSGASSTISSGDTAWVLVSAALVMLMTPALGLFYGGMVRQKNVLSTILQSFFLLAAISVQWVIIGYSLAFSPGNDFIGGLSWAFLRGAGVPNPSAPTIPGLAFVMFQCMFAAITPALISGSFAERIQFKGFVFFSLLWTTLVYDPICHWVWGGGIFEKMGALDFAGGTVVHMSSGFSALVLALLLGSRIGYGKNPMIPHDLTLVLTGASLLWFGWFGFNAGSALGANALAANAFMTTNTAAAVAALTWCCLEALHKDKASSLGAASGAVAGLVAITPACGYVDIVGAILIGIVASLVCYNAILLKLRFKYDDSLDAFGIHGIGGTWGALATGLFATQWVNSHGNNGLFYGNPHQFLVQLKTVAATALYATVMTLILFWIVDKTVGMRVSAKEEEIGLDLSQHGEEAYRY